MAERPSNLTGAAGVFYTAAKLSELGFVVAPTLRNARGIDVLANQKGKSVGIQVKTTTNKKSWMLGEKDEENYSDNTIYVFVYLGEKVDYHIVPSRTVATQIKEAHAEWLRTPGRKGQSHNETSMRRFWRKGNETYLEDWSVLGL